MMEQDRNFVCTDENERIGMTESCHELYVILSDILGILRPFIHNQPDQNKLGTLNEVFYQCREMSLHKPWTNWSYDSRLFRKNK